MSDLKKLAEETSKFIEEDNDYSYSLQEFLDKIEASIKSGWDLKLL